MLKVSDDFQIGVEPELRLPWPYIRLIKGYRCLDCCSLIEFEERASYFATGFCDYCRPLHPATRWPRMPGQVRIVKTQRVDPVTPRY
jgi:hypothetical protein